jgi:hypothetical protein
MLNSTKDYPLRCGNRTWMKETITGAVKVPKRRPRYNLVNPMQVSGARKKRTKVATVTVKVLSRSESGNPNA